MYKFDPLDPFTPEEEAALKASLDQLSALPIVDPLDPFTPEENVAFEATLDAMAAAPIDFDALDTPSSGAPAGPVPPPFGAAAPVPAGSSARTVRITIRLPVGVMQAVRNESRRRGIRYQTLINDTLRQAAAKW